MTEQILYPILEDLVFLYIDGKLSECPVKFCKNWKKGVCWNPSCYHLEVSKKTFLCWQMCSWGVLVLLEKEQVCQTWKEVKEV